MMKTLILGPTPPKKQKIPEFYLYWLDIFPSCRPMQFKGKLMNQTWENAKKKTNSWSDFGLFGPDVGPQNLFCRI